MDTSDEQARNRRRVFGLSVATLFLELLVIRWTGSHVLYLSYFSNFVLLGCFLGLGAGALTARRSFDLFPAVPVALALLVGLVLGLEVQVQIDSPDNIYFQAGRGRVSLPDYLLLPLVFVVVSSIFVCLGQAIGRGIARSGPPLVAYTWNVAGSLVGIGLFTLASWLRAPAWAWFALASVGIIPFLPTGRPRVLGAVLLAGIVVGVGFAEAGDSWSPYYRWRITNEDRSEVKCELDICLREGRGPTTVTGRRHRLRVNSVTHQYISDFRQREPFYEFPYLALGRPAERVLIIGAGNGTDTAFGLAHGARRIDAVEIDPDIATLGFGVNPNKPYADPRVRLIVNDGRAVLERSTELYDLVVFGLPDSLTLASSHSSVRLESFLFTVEAMRAARRRLKPDGLLVLYNYYREPWLVQKLATMTAEAFGHPPIILKGPHRYLTAVLLAAHTPERQGQVSKGLGKEWGFERVAWDKSAAVPATDDWPFLYLRTPSVPGIYIRFVIPVALYSLLLTFWLAPASTRRRPDWPFFFMGAAFLLLETVSVVRFALVFGSTWLVNAIVFSSILVMVLLANLICMRWRIQRAWPLVVLLMAALAAQAAVPLRALLELDGAARYFAAGLLVFSPVFVANVLYARLFRETEAADRAFAWNLLGAMGGGLLEYLALGLGYTTLLVAVALLYALTVATALMPRRRLA